MVEPIPVFYVFSEQRGLGAMAHYEPEFANEELTTGHMSTSCVTCHKNRVLNVLCV
jgi:hypothetical protein